MSIPSRKESDHLACGIIPETSCAECRKAIWPPSELAPMDVARETFERVRGHYWRLLRATRPEPLQAEDLGRLVWIFLDPYSRPLLRQLVLDLLEGGAPWKE
jgi:hypothetical protein